MNWCLTEWFVKHFCWTKQIYLKNPCRNWTQPLKSTKGFIIPFLLNLCCIKYAHTWNCLWATFSNNNNPHNRDMSIYKKFLTSTLFTLNNSLTIISLITISLSCTFCAKNTLTLRLNSKRHSKLLNNAAGNFSTSKGSSKSNSIIHIKPSNNLLQVSYLIKALISILEGLSVSYSKELKEKYNNKRPNIIPKRSWTLKMLISSKIRSKQKNNKSTFKSLSKIVSKTYKNLSNFKMINKKYLFGSVNFSSLMRLLINHQEHCKKYKTNVLNYWKLNFGWISILENLINVDK